MPCRIVSVLVLCGLTAVAAESGFEAHTADPFVMDLWPDALPASARPITHRAPLTITAARGETTSALLILRARGHTPPFRVSGGALAVPDNRVRVARVRVRLIRSLRRATPYAAVAGRRYPERYSRRDGILLPDILVRDEPALDAAVATWRGALPDEAADAPAASRGIAAGRMKYFLVTVGVPAEAKPGRYDAAVRVEGRNVLDVPLRLIVRPLALAEVRSRILGVSNEFCEPDSPLVEPSLRLLGEIGMTFTRTADLLSHRESARYFAALRKYGFTTISFNRPPASAADLRKIPAGFNAFFYGRDEPQPKDPARRDWSRMAEHVRLSRRIHAMGGKVTTSLPYSLALELRDRTSRVYRELAKHGLKDAHEPLDWANLGLGLQRLGGRRRPGEGNEDLFRYIATLQAEFRAARWTPGRPALGSKHPWIETYYWPQGLIRYPYFARLLFGFYLFNSHLDGAMAWTLYRPRGKNPLAPGAAPVATLGYPGKTTVYSTYSLEAIREGVNDLRYAEQAYRAVARLLNSPEAAKRALGDALRRRFLDTLKPYEKLLENGGRIDLGAPRPERDLQKTREALAEIILRAAG